MEQVCSRLQRLHEAAEHDGERSRAEEEGEGRTQSWPYYDTPSQLHYLVAV